MKIAVYAPALNEAHHLSEWVQANSGADYKVIADTGSTDGTLEIAQAMGVQCTRISVQPWRFDTGRNVALSLVPVDADICVICDLDERPAPNFYSELRKNWDPERHLRGWVTMDTGHFWWADRIHARHGFRWVAPCHEIAEPTIYMNDERALILPVTLTHKQTPGRTHREGYIDLLKTGIAERPDDPRMVVYLIREFSYKGDWAGMLEWAPKLLEMDAWPPEKAAVCRWAGMAAEQLGYDGEEWFRRGLHEMPDELEPILGLAAFYYAKERWEECARVCARVEEIPHDTVHYLAENEARWALYDLGAQANHHVGRRDEAVRMGLMAIELSPVRELDRCQTNQGFYEEGLAA